jgi:hypothetical protein
MGPSPPRDAAVQLDSDTRWRPGTVIASLVLLPTLVATVYGANVALPLEGRLAGTALMLLVMAVTGLVAWLALRARYSRDRRQRD